MEVYVSKSYIAFHSGSQSGIQTHEKAMKWAQDQMTGGRVDKVHIAQIIEVVERSTPPITVSRFEPEPAYNEPQVLKDGPSYCDHMATKAA